MGALHQGHLALVQASLAQNERTLLSIFLNPAQFAPHEDLHSYPRTLQSDLHLLSTLPTQPHAVFLPSVHDIYPSGITQHISAQHGTFVQVYGYDHQLEGKSRPTFFRGVATVVTKLFNLVQPTNAYFGQKDIQQALLLRRLCADLFLTHPDPDHLHIVPTVRDPSDGLALSSRNAYISPLERPVAGILRAALTAAETAWTAGSTKHHALNAALDLVHAKQREIQDARLDVHINLDYIDINHPHTFESLDPTSSLNDHPDPAILSGALWVGKTRLLDNIILGNANEILF